MRSELMFSRASDEWATPQDFFDGLDAEFRFELDVAATEDNAKMLPFISPAQDALTVDWCSFFQPDAQPICWMNCPYSRCREFIAKAAKEAQKGCTVVCLVPSRTDTRWWHQHVWNAETNGYRPGVEVRFIKGRLKFGNSENSAPFPSVVIIFRPVGHDTVP